MGGGGGGGGGGEGRQRPKFFHGFLIPLSIAIFRGGGVMDPLSCSLDLCLDSVKNQEK